MPSQQGAERRTILFIAFFLSGFCGLLYQTIWLRLAFANFGVITPVVSVIVSVFMLGLGAGSFYGGKVARFLKSRTKQSALVFYAILELFIGVGAYVVPWLFGQAGDLLLPSGESNSSQYLLFSSLLMGGAIVPFCLAMGLTIPFVMEFLTEYEGSEKSSFSFLYLANVLGAVTGILSTAVVLIEVFALKHTLAIASYFNFLIAFVCIIWAYINDKQRAGSSLAESAAQAPQPVATGFKIPWFTLTILFVTGLSSMAMEVVWTRAFNTVLGTQVYAFARLVATYLAATFLGSLWYRLDLQRSKVKSKQDLLTGLALVSFLPIILPDARIGLLLNVESMSLICLASIAPLCGILGYLTPSLIDECSEGDAVKAGHAYAVNIIGSILGPLAAGYLLLPVLGGKISLIILAVPLVCLAGVTVSQMPKRTAVVSGVMIVGMLLGSMFSCSYEDGGVLQSIGVLRRDHVATVLSTGKGMHRLLFVNGHGMTALATITKLMAHVPLSYHRGQPQSALVICFGMGTTFRALLSWGIEATAVELVPSVPKAMSYYHEDAPQVFANPKGRVVIDDGRRFLKRTNQMFDVITMDPPPPVEAAGSSLLYSKQFYEEIKAHLKPNGILQQWFPDNDRVMEAAVARSLFESFKYVRALPGLQPGVHFLASDQPIDKLTVDDMLSRMPENAKKDLLEWYDPAHADELLRKDLKYMISQDVDAHAFTLPYIDPVISDDRPFNEYHLVRDAILCPVPYFNSN